MEEKKLRILLVEDDLSFGKILKDYLSLNSIDVMHVKDGLDGWDFFRKHHFDLCILDIMMPKRDGFELAKEIRRENRSVPIFFLTSKAQKTDMINGYEAGADDYIVKPVDADVLMHKIKAILKRTNDTMPSLTTEQIIFNIGRYHFDFQSRALTVDNQKHILTPTEAELLRMLASHMNELVLREDILRTIWREVNYFTGRSLDVYMFKLRKYLQQDDKITIVNRHKSGYVMQVKK